MSWKKIGQGLLFPPRWLKLILIIISFASLVTIVSTGLSFTHELALYYITIAYSLVVLVALCIKEVPRKHKFVKDTLYENKYTRLYMTDVALRTRLSLYPSLLINILFISFNFVSAVIYHSNWFGIFAVYYGLIGLMRFLILHHMHTQKIGDNQLSELKRSRLCALILLTINVILSGVVFMMAYLHNGFEYRGLLIYGIAISTFTLVIIDIVDVIKYRNYQCPLVSISKVIRMTSALFSILFIETSLLAQLGWNLSGDMQSFIIILTGFGISITVIFMSIYMIVRTTKEIKSRQLKQKNQDN